MQAQNEREKIERLLEHWMEHNSEHVAEFVAWADRAKSLERPAVPDGIVGAARQLEKANEFLLAALNALKES
jgi:hypothetical protein